MDGLISRASMVELEAASLLPHGAAVLFMDDFTRCGANGLAHHAANRAWLRRLLAPALSAAGNPVTDWPADADDVAGFMDALGLPASPEGWAATSRLSPLPGRAATWLDTRLKGGAIVIGFELPVFLLRHLSARGIPFIDVAIDPVRFARDLFFRVRTSLPAVERRLRHLEVCEDLLWTDAALLAGHALRRHPPIHPDPAATITVFFGQTCVDRALVQDGRLADPRAYAPAIARAAAGTDALLISPHPYEPLHGLVDDLAALLPQASVTTANAYALLANDQVRRVVSLSSSLMTEARYFGVPAVSLLTPDVDDPGLGSRWHRVDTALISPALWAGLPTPSPPAPNLLRDSLGITWARELPLAPRAAPPPPPPPRWRRVARAGMALMLALMM